MFIKTQLFTLKNGLNPIAYSSLTFFDNNNLRVGKYRLSTVRNFGKFYFYKIDLTENRNLISPDQYDSLYRNQAQFEAKDRNIESWLNTLTSSTVKNVIITLSFTITLN